MWKKEVKSNLVIFMKAGLPYTAAGMAVVFLGIYLLKHWLSDSEYLTVLIFLWLGLFWTVYQPLFRSRILKEKRKLRP
jgi:uncharacterized membrane protein YfcA